MKLADVRSRDLAFGARALRRGTAFPAVLLPFAQCGEGLQLLRNGTVQETIAAFFALPGEASFDPMRYRFPATGIPAVRAVVLVLQAARGRCRLYADDRITVPELAALAGVDASYCRRLAREGVLVRCTPEAGSRSPIEGATAARFLREHNVAPWSAR